jgi:acetolactate synthase-1/2/3 large subunit
MRFVDWLCCELARRGTRVAFGVPGGGSSLDLLHALGEHGVRVVLSAREDAATIMAGISGALAGAPGLAFSTKGPGLASAGNGLACAALDRLPALLVTEDFDAAELGYLTHQVFDQREAATALLHPPGAGVLRARTDEVLAWLAQRPAPLRAPAVLLAAGAAHTAPVDPGARAPAAAEPALDPTALQRARALLAQARRPVAVLGLEATRGDAAAATMTFLETLGAPALTTYMAKGTIPDAHPLWAGVFTGGAIEQACVNDADLVVTVGLDPVELIRKPWPYATAVLDLCEQVHRPHYFDPAVRLCAPLSSSLPALASAPVASDWTAAAIAAHREHFLDGMRMPDDGGLDAASVVRAAAEAFAPRPRLSVDAGAHMFSACAFWPCERPLDLLISNGLATMGFALPAGIAAALHDPARGAVAMTGDGGLLMCLGELKTAAETGAELCVIVFNDARLSLIDIKREDRQFPELGMSWEAPDFAAAARGFGLQAWRITRRSQLAPVLAEASAARGPRLVDVRIDSAGYREQLRALRG